MKTNYAWVALGCAVALLLTAGCETTGGNQTQTTIYDTHKRMVKLDKELGSSVTQLTESTATLNARLDESDQQTRMLLGILEENRVKLDTLSRELESMKTTLYRHWNLTTTGASSASRGSVSTGTVTIEGPATEPATVQTPPPDQTPPPVPTPPPAQTLPAAETPVTPQTQPKSLLEDSAPLPTETASQVANEEVAAPLPAEPAAPVVEQIDPGLMYQQAQRSFANDDFSGALTQFNEFLSKYPDNELSANAQFWKGKCQFNLNQYDESVRSFEGLRGKFSSSTKVPFAMHNQAVAHSRLGQTDEAIRLMEAVIEQYPASPAADQARADLRKLRGE